MATDCACLTCAGRESQALDCGKRPRAVVCAPLRANTQKTARVSGQRGNQARDPDDCDRALEIVGEHGQANGCAHGDETAAQKVALVHAGGR